MLYDTENERCSFWKVTFSHGLSPVPESSLKSKRPGFALGDGTELLHHQPQLDGEFRVLFYNKWQNLLIGK